MTDTPHLDDEQLSAALDDQDEPGTRQHLTSCDACLARLAGLDDVRQAVGAGSAPMPEGLADRAVAAALAAFTAERQQVPRPAASEPRPSLAGGGGAVATGRTGATSPEPEPGTIVPLRRRRVPTWALGAAAAVAALLVAVPVLTRIGGSDDSAQVAQTETGFQATGASLDERSIDGGDLGAQGDQRALGRLLQTAVGSGPAALAAPAPDEAAAAADDSRATAEAGGVDGTPAPAAAPTPGGTASTVPPSAAPKYTAGPVPCADTVREEYGEGLEELVYQARLEWKGQPAVVLAYRLVGGGDAGPGYRAFVMALEACELLVVQGF